MAGVLELGLPLSFQKRNAEVALSSPISVIASALSVRFLFFLFIL